MSGSPELDAFLRDLADGPNVLASTDDLEATLRSRSCRRIQTLNLHHLDLFERDPDFRRATRSAGAWTADGWPVRLAFRRLGCSTARVTGRELCQRLATEPGFATGTTRVALLGASHDAGDRFGELLTNVGRELVVREHGPIDEWPLEELARAVRACDATLVLVAVSPPGGELLAERMATLLDGHPSVVVGVGGAIDMAVGLRRAAPAAVSRTGLEWLWRLVQEPRRMASRYLRDGLPAFARLAVTVSRR